MTTNSKDAQSRAQEHYARAIELEREGKDPSDEYGRGLALSPEEWAYQNRGWFYFKKGDFAAALADWNHVSDDYAKPRGRAKLKVGDVDGAIADLEIALAAKSETDLHGYLAEAYEAKGDAARAAEHRAKAEEKPAPPPPKPAKRKKAETYDAYVDRLLGALPDAKLRKGIDALRKPAFFVSTVKKAPKEVGASRLGGEPDMPASAVWPEHDGKPMSFLGQFDLGEIARIGSSALPKKGLLSLFVGEDEGAYLESTKVFHFANPKEPLSRRELPKDFVRGVDGELVRKAYTPRGVSLSVARKLPSPSNPVCKKLKWTQAEEIRYSDLYEATVEFSRHQLLGFRDRSYDGEQKATTALLFQCFSDGELGAEWGDDDHVYVYIPEKALAAGDFSKAFAYSGE